MIGDSMDTAQTGAASTPAPHPYEVHVIKEGYSYNDQAGTLHACGTVTLVRGGRWRVLVDTGSPWCHDAILQGLSQLSLSPDQIDYVVCTHGHSDHVGNLNLFTNATHLLANDVCRRDSYLQHRFHEGIPYEIDESIEVIATPGHTSSCLSVKVKNTAMGTVFVCGDLFESFEDLEKPNLWQDCSENPEVQHENRLQVLREADVIVPGHGPMFRVPDHNVEPGFRIISLPS